MAPTPTPRKVSSPSDAAPHGVARRLEQGMGRWRAGTRGREAPPFTADTAYTRFTAYTLLHYGSEPEPEHFSAAAADLALKGYKWERHAFPAYAAADLLEHFPHLREPVIDGLLRRGETMG